MSGGSQDFEIVTSKMDFSLEEKGTLYTVIEPILNHEIWNLMRSSKHHLDSRAIHSLEVCCKAWRRGSKSKRCDEKTIAIGALLHDFFFYDWQNEKIDITSLTIERKMFGPKNHGFMHPLIALDNAYKYFPELIDDKIEDIIIKHMWPLTLKLPKYRETWFVCWADKSCSLNIVKKPKQLPHYFGISKKKK